MLPFVSASSERNNLAGTIFLWVLDRSQVMEVSLLAQLTPALWESKFIELLEDDVPCFLELPEHRYEI